MYCKIIKGYSWPSRDKTLNEIINCRMNSMVKYCCIAIKLSKLSENFDIRDR